MKKVKAREGTENGRDMRSSSEQMRKPALTQRSRYAQRTQRTQRSRRTNEAEEKDDEAGRDCKVESALETTKGEQR